MALDTALTASILKEYQRDEKDTGSSEVQIALLTKRISQLTEHLGKFKKDNHSRRGLLNIVGQRRKLLDYLKKSNFSLYSKIIEKLEIRR